jgi:hypothetical protein
MVAFSMRFAAGLLVILASSCESYDAGLLRRASSDSQAGPPPEVVCGDGKVEGAELCDTAILAEQEGACPVECKSDDACSPLVLAGSDCETQCAGLTITHAQSGDGCCPDGVGGGEDSDCGSCGDAIVGPAETCDPPSGCPTRETCSQSSACIFGVFSGDPALCTADCNVGLTDQCVDDDDCCPAGCNNATDNDCSQACGDAIVQAAAGETCEPASEEYPCPESCDDGTPCTNDILAGSVENCNVECGNVPILVPTNDDGCCPENANSLNDTDCLPACGNGVPEGSETCDPCPDTCDDGSSCTVDSRSGDSASCSVVCSHTPISGTVAGDGCCPPGANATTDSDCAPQCGNLVKESGESCDGGPQCNGTCQRAIHSSIVHRYNFASNANDSIGNGHGSLQAGASISGGAVTLSGGDSGGYVRLPAGLVSGHTSITVEVWVRWTTTSQRQRLFECGRESGTEATNFMFITPRNSSDKFAAYLNFTSAVNDTGNDKIAADTVRLATAAAPNFTQVAATFDGSKLSLYRDGELEGGPTSAGSGNDLADIDDDLCYLGASIFDAPDRFGGVVTELRIYGQALSLDELRISESVGPDPP